MCHFVRIRMPQNEYSRDQVWCYPCSRCYAWWRYCYSDFSLPFFNIFWFTFVCMCVGCSVFLSYIDSVSICDGWSRLNLCVIRYLNKPCDNFVVFTSIDIRFLHHTQCTCQLLFFWRTENIRYTNLLCCIYYYSTPAFNHPGAIKEKIEAVGAVIEVQYKRTYNNHSYYVRF